MKDEELVALLRDVARSQSGGRDPRLEKLTLGELDAETTGALEADAACDETLARDVALSRPLDAAARERMHARLLVALGGEAGALVSPEPLKPLPGVEGGIVVGRGATARPPYARRGLHLWGRRGVAAAAALALAASIALFVGHPPQAPIATYEVTVESADVATRSGAGPATADDTGPRVQSSPRFELVARPSVAVAPPLVARAFAVHAGQVHEWTTGVELSADGSVRIAGPVAELFADPHGAWEVIVAVGRPGAAPPAESALLGTATEGVGWRLLRARVELRGR